MNRIQLTYRSILIENFMGIRHEHHEFSPTSNKIIGLNEAGKSRLNTAVRTAFLESHKGSGKQKQRYRTWGSKDTPRLTLEFSLNGTDYTIEKQFQA